MFQIDRNQLEHDQTTATIRRIESDVARSATESKRTRAETLAAYCKAAMFLAIGLAALGLAY